MSYSKISWLFADNTFREYDEIEYLYHYTTHPGAYGILESGVIWASDPRFLNDAAEVELGREACLDAIEHLTKNLPDSTVMKKHEVEGILDNLTIRFEQVGKEQLAAGFTCIACFSSKDDDLSQWRAYGNHDGVMLAFHKSILEAAEAPRTTDGANDVSLARVLYMTKNDFIPHIVSEIEKRISGPYVMYVSNDRDTRSRKEKLVELVGDLSEALWSLIPYMKDIGFQSEDEWRLIVRQANMRWRIGKKYHIPYTEVRYDTQFCKDIWVRLGPGSSPLAEHYYSKRTQRVETSEVPYRAS